MYLPTPVHSYSIQAIQVGVLEQDRLVHFSVVNCQSMSDFQISNRFRHLRIFYIKLIQFVWELVNKYIYNYQLGTFKCLYVLPSQKAQWLEVLHNQSDDCLSLFNKNDHSRKKIQKIRVVINKPIYHTWLAIYLKSTRYIHSKYTLLLTCTYFLISAQYVNIVNLFFFDNTVGLTLLHAFSRFCRQCNYFLLPK